MNLGLSILLSAMLVSITVLYINTRNVWSWNEYIKKILTISKWALVVVISLLVISFAIISIVNYFNNMPKKLNTYMGLILGDEERKVTMIFGKPLPADPAMGIAEIKTMSFFYPSDSNPSVLLTVSISRDGKVVGVATHRLYYLETMTRDDILRTYGQPTTKSTISIFEWWKYPNRNLEVSFCSDPRYGDTVFSFGIYDSDYYSRISKPSK